MSSHADTIRRALTKVVQDAYLTDYHDDAQAAYDAYDALLAENQRLREALERIAAMSHGHRDSLIARDALAGDTE